MKAIVAAFNQEKALVGAFSVITNLRMELFQALVVTIGEHYLEALHEGPEQDADSVALPQQLDQPSRAEQTQETHVEEVFLKS